MVPKTKATSEQISLRVEGMIYSHWKEFSIRRSIHALSGSFEFTLTGIAFEKSLPLQAGSLVKLQLGSDALITGFIDSVSLRLDATQKSITVSGRDQTGDLVDSSAVMAKLPWQDVKFEKIASDLIAPYPIPLKLKTDTGEPFLTWTIQSGESVFECLDRAAHARGLWLSTNGEGALVVAKPNVSAPQASLREAENCLSLSKVHDVKAQYQTYRMKAHLPPSFALQEDNSFLIEAQVNDSQVKRPRTLCLQGEGFTKQDLNLKLDWEKSTRRAQSLKITVVVQGFRSCLGELWAVGDFVKLESSFLGYFDSFKIASVHFQLHPSSGKTTTLELESWDCLSQDPSLKRKLNPYQEILRRESG